jgi:hypothetical protein
MFLVEQHKLITLWLMVVDGQLMEKLYRVRSI